MEKFYSSKALLKMAGGGMHTPYPPGSVPVSALVGIKNKARKAMN